MLITHAIDTAYQKDGKSITGRLTVTGDSEVNIERDWTEAPTGLDLEQAIALGNMKSCGVVSSVAATLVTKAAGGAEVKSIPLAAGVPQIAATHAACDALLGATAVSLHLTSAAAAGTLKFYSLNDSTT